MCWPFLKPFDPEKLGLNAHEKSKQQPMDLLTIKTNLDNNKYLDPDDFTEDVRLVWTNAFQYFTKGSLVYQYAQTLSDEFELKLRSITEGNLSKKKKMGYFGIEVSSVG